MRRYISRLIDCLEPYILRRFYLYEDYPHLFLALELKDNSFFNPVTEIISDLYRPRFIKKYTTSLSDDSGNGEEFLTVLDATCKALMKKDLTDYMESQPKKKLLTHIVHCMMDMIFGSRKEELKFYKEQYYLYSGKRLKK